MSNFAKFSSLYQESTDDILDQLNDIYLERLNTIFMDLDVELRRPMGNGFAYERCVKGKIRSVQLWVSKPNFEIPLLMCRFEVRGEDQFGVAFDESVKESEFLTKIPWQNFVPFGEFMVIPEENKDGGVS